MKKITAYTLNGLAIAVFGACMVLAFLAYFVVNGSVAEGDIRDGLGRNLTKSPAIVRIILRQERLWAGWLWFVVDLLWFYAGFALAWWMFRKSGALQGIDVD